MWADTGALKQKRAFDVVTLATVTTVVGAVDTTSSAVYLPRPNSGVIFVLDVTAAATDAGDTLDVQVQTCIDGTNYVPVCSFTQVLGNGGAKRHIAKISATEPQAMFEAATALAAGSIRHLIGDAWKVKYVQVDADNDAVFTFSVKAIAI